MVCEMEGGWHWLDRQRDNSIKIKIKLQRCGYNEKD